jgi:GNAT superfamily N-acetyltransferase
MTPTTRLATADDIAEIVRLRGLIFERRADDRPWESRCATLLEKAIHEGWIVVAVIDQATGAELAAVGSAEIHQRLPSPDNPSGRVGYIGTMATEPAFRGQGMASVIVRRLITELKDRGVDRIELHATPVAEDLYRAAGFGDRPGGVEMRLLDA